MAGGDNDDFCVKCKEVIKITETVLVCSLWCRKPFHYTCLGLTDSEAHAVACSKLGIKFHCETCEKRLGIKLFGEKEPRQPENVEKCINYCVNLLDLVQKLVKVTTEVLNHSSAINSKLDAVLRSHAKLEEYLAKSPKGFAKRSEEALDNSALSVESDSLNGITEIREQYDDTNKSTQNISNKQMTCAPYTQQSDNSLLSIVSDFSEQSADSLHPCQQENIAADCSPNCEQDCEEPNGRDESPRIIKVECSPSEVTKVIAEERGDQEVEEREVIEAGTKRCSSSEEFLGPSTFSTQNADDDEAKEAVRNVSFEFQEVKQEVDMTDAGSETESSIPVVMEGSKSDDDGGVVTVSLAARKEKRIRNSTKLVAEAYGNKTGEMYLGHRLEEELEELQEFRDLHRRNGVFSCSVCHKTFKKRSNLKQHFVCHTGERPYRCSVCSKTFSYSSNLKQHLLVHTGEGPFRCSVCNKEFRLSLSLKQHMLLHTGESPYKCSYCSKAFSRKGNLKEHLRVHTGERPYKCSICHKAFKLLSSIHRHSRLHTGEYADEISFWQDIHKQNSTEVEVTFTPIQL